MPLTERFTVALPEWVSGLADALPDRLASIPEAMDVAVALSRRNMAEGSGGPFGALVLSEAGGEWISLGVNRVEPDHCSAAHAEIVALGLAQRRLGTWSLADVPQAPLMLVSSCEPCAMCLGAIPWSGVAALVCGAARADAEAAGFDEGDRPADWQQALVRRGIRVQTEVRRRHAAAVLAEFHDRGGRAYNP